MIEVPTVLNLAQRRIDWVPSWSKGELFSLGNCSFHHGRKSCGGSERAD
jgi:hypothetical protein